MPSGLPICSWWNYPRAAARRPALGVLAGALISLLGAGDLCAEVPVQATVTSSRCIKTPSEYMTAFTNCLPITCVSPDLYATVMVGPPDAQPDIYPHGFHWAWTSGSENLMTYADWHRSACRNPAKGPAVSNKILLYVGFSQDYIDSWVKGEELNLAVMDLSRERSLFVPTPAAWFEAFQQKFDLAIPLATQKALTLGLGLQPNRSTVPLNPNQVFADITGCSLAGAAKCTDEPVAACSRSYRSMARVLAPLSPYGGSTTGQCVEAFKQRLGGRVADAAETRAMLYYCQDVNACNTGNGYGYNPRFPSAGGPPAAHFTGPEFVLLNQPRSKVGAVLTRLATIPR